MPNKREYKFEINAYTRDTMPMKRLAEYLRDFVALFGEENSVHLIRVDDGSTCPIAIVDWEAEPKILSRLAKVRDGNGPKDAMEASAELDKRLAQDNGSGHILGPEKNKVLEFPGALRDKPIEWPTINQANTFYGIPILVGGKNNPVPVHLEDGTREVHLLADREKAKDIAKYLFTTVLRVFGHGRWKKLESGEWDLERFVIEEFEPLKNETLDDVVKRMRNIDAAWKKLDDPIGRLDDIRRGKRQ